MLTTNVEAVKAGLERLGAQRGMSGIREFFGAFTTMEATEKFQLQTKGYEPAYIEELQKTVRTAKELIDPDIPGSESMTFIARFKTKAEELTTGLLDESEKRVKAERSRYLRKGLFSESPRTEATDPLQAAARELSQKRGVANQAGSKALKSQYAFLDMEAKLQGPLHPELKEQYDKDREAWLKEEKEYAALRASKERDYPILAAYAVNDDGKAKGRLDNLASVSGDLLKQELSMQADQKLLSIAWIRGNLTERRLVWSESNVMRLTKLAMKTTPWQERLVEEHREAIKFAQEEQEKMRTAILIGIGVLAAIATGGGAAAALAGDVAATAVFAGMGEAVTGAAAIMSIAQAYSSLMTYSEQSAMVGTDFDKAKALSSDEPSFQWVALDLIMAGLDIVAAAPAFKAIVSVFKEAVVARTPEGFLKFFAKVEEAAPRAAKTIVPQAIEEAEKAGAFEEALIKASESGRYKGKELGQISVLLEKYFNRHWSDFFNWFASKKKVRALTEEAIEAVFGHLPARSPGYSSRAAELIAKDKVLTWQGFYEGGFLFVKEGAEIEVGHMVVHELTHGLEETVKARKYNDFMSEFEAYSSQREFLDTARKHGYPLKPDHVRFVEMSDREMAEFITRAYGHEAPPWVAELGPKGQERMNAAYLDVLRRVKSFPGS